MLRLIHILSLSAALAATSGCITPARISTVESDAALRALIERAIPPVVVPATPMVVAEPPENLLSQPAENPALATVSVLTKQPPAPQPPPAPLPNPPPAPAPNPPTAAPPEPLPRDPGLVQRVKPIEQISLDISVRDTGDMFGRIPPPENYAAQALPQLAQEEPFLRGDLIDYGMYDNTPLPPVSLDLCYQPLYFQELNAERYGRTWGILQPAVSMANFYGRIPLLPYMAFAYPARRCTYHAHWSLPGYRIPGREPHDLVVSPTGGAPSGSR